MKMLLTVMLVLMMLMSGLSQAEPLNDANLKPFLVKYQADYKKQSQTLLKAFEQFQKKGDYQGFALFKNNQWHPVFDKQRFFYDDFLEENRVYINSKDGLFSLFVEFDELALSANYLWRDLKDSTKTHRVKEQEKIKTNINNIKTLLKSKI